MAHSHDVLILGRGIAGAVLAETLLQRGLRVHVFDHKRPGNASMVAAGLVNPVVLRRDVPSWRALEMLDSAETFYTTLEQRLACCFWHPLELVKLFPGEREVAQWERAMQDPITSKLIDRRAQATMDAAPVNALHGYGTVHRCAWLDVPTFLDAQRSQLLREGCLTEVEISAQEIAHLDDGVRIADRTAPCLVRCEGPFADIPGLVPVQGEGLTVRLPELKVDRALHRGVFLLPQGDDIYRVGATFKWDAVWEGPTAEGRRWLLEQLTKLTPVVPEVLEHWAGVRPASADRRPNLGRTAAHAAVFNGLGARGVMLAPWCATHLAEHLFDGRPLDAEVDLGRFA